MPSRRFEHRSLRVGIDGLQVPPSVIARLESRFASIQWVANPLDATHWITPDPVRARQTSDQGIPTLLCNPWQHSPADASTPGHACLHPALLGRYRPDVQTVHRAITDGRLGRIGLIRIHGWYPPDTSWQQRLAEWTDATLWLVGQDIARHSIQTDREALNLHLVFADSAMAILEIRAAPWCPTPYETLWAIGRNGAACIDDARAPLLLAGPRAMQAVSVPHAWQASAIMIESFLKQSRVPPQPAWQAVAQVHNLLHQAAI